MSQFSSLSLSHAPSRRGPAGVLQCLCGLGGSARLLLSPKAGGQGVNRTRGHLSASLGGLSDSSWGQGWGPHPTLALLRGRFAALGLPPVRHTGCKAGSPVSPRWGQQVRVTPDAPHGCAGREVKPPGSHSLRRGYIWCRICIAANRRTWAASEILRGARARGVADDCHTQAGGGRKVPADGCF